VAGQGASGPAGSVGGGAKPAAPGGSGARARGLYSRAGPSQSAVRPTSGAAGAWLGGNGGEARLAGVGALARPPATPLRANAEACGPTLPWPIALPARRRGALATHAAAALSGGARGGARGGRKARRSRAARGETASPGACPARPPRHRAPSRCAVCEAGGAPAESKARQSRFQAWEGQISSWYGSHGEAQPAI